ncbi:GGDEF domain-containing protein [Sphingomonas crocodyli]|uniref:diguanylate cyclase n=1 Tax=Sphingomonas crocodyli TaxID=1979270 RepID=A0A437M9R2_9SPHN|nr:GGDEF domain-containing protein [Sphingomonas crocodyli]RVT94356.1 GGDEF domain-containing protein [Sphingomonas crocodyli]
MIVISLWYPQSSALLPRIPMLSDQLLLGILNLSLLAIPAERARERLQAAASRDPLTGAWNRDGLARFGADLVGPGAAVLAIDVDHFKAINDDHGHGSGDDVLVAVADTANSLVAPQKGAVFRIGGDEFLAILPRCDAAKSRQIADRLRRFDQGDGLPDCTLSIGIALVETPTLDVEAAIRSADDALYRAKALGRDRIHLVTA